MNDDQAALDAFSGTTPVFPLPGLVFFPRGVQPLHIFEPRYRQMTADALAGGRLIALTMLGDGWEHDYDHRPNIHSVACLGRIVADQLLPDGRYNLMLRGLARVRIVREPPTDKLYRLADVEILHDVVTDDIDELMRLRHELAAVILPRIAGSDVRDQLEELFHGELTLGPLCDLLAFSLPLPPDTKQALLEELHVTARARLLVEAFQALVGGPAKPLPNPMGKPFPPEFSAN